MVLQPDVSRSRRDFIADIVASLVLDGNAFTRIVRDWKGEIVTCEMLPPQYVTVTDESDDPARPDLRFSYLAIPTPPMTSCTANSSTCPADCAGSAPSRRHARRSMPRSSPATTRRGSSRTARTSRLSAHIREHHTGSRAAGQGIMEGVGRGRRHQGSRQEPGIRAALT